MSYHSQGAEDYLLEDLNKKLGISQGWFVEFGAKDGYTLSNTARLMEDFGWSGVYIEADKELATALIQNMSKNPKIHPIHAMVTAENINKILETTPVPQDFDLLSIDIDGMDYWVWQAITYRPKIVCIEYNSNFLPNESKTLPYNPKHIYNSDIGKHFGASSLALRKLGIKKGYKLVAYTSLLNVLFVRNDLASEMPEFIEIPQADNHPDRPNWKDDFIEVK